MSHTTHNATIGATVLAITAGVFLFSRGLRNVEELVAEMDEYEASAARGSEVSP